MKQIEIRVNSRSAEAIEKIAASAKAYDFHVGFIDEQGVCIIRMLVEDQQLQAALDK
ncbi:MAG: hypothetical protein HQL48_06215, partial [Gammaproteobacteria bacterium]|nr:hypothetical protein [Gammaproteobacteria bacterium]